MVKEAKQVAVITDDSYQSLVEDCKALMTEYVFNSRWTLIEGHHELGKRISDEKTPITKFVKRLANDLKMSERNLWYAVQFYQKFPDLEKLPGGKNVTWTRVRRLLPAATKEIEDKEPTPMDIATKLYNRYHPDLAAKIIPLWQDMVSEFFHGDKV